LHPLAGADGVLWASRDTFLVELEHSGTAPPQLQEPATAWRGRGQAKGGEVITEGMQAGMQ